MKPHKDSSEDDDFASAEESSTEPLRMEFTGIDKNTFYRFGGLLFSMQVDGYPDSEPIKKFLDAIDGKHIRVLIEEIP